MENPFQVRHVFFSKEGRKMENVFTFLPTFPPFNGSFSFSLSWMCPSRYKNSNFPQRVTHNPVSEFNRFPFHRSREFSKENVDIKRRTQTIRTTFGETSILCVSDMTLVTSQPFELSSTFTTPHFTVQMCCLMHTRAIKFPVFFFPFQIAVIRYYLKIPINGALNDKTFTALKPGLVDIAERI